MNTANLSISRTFVHQIIRIDFDIMRREIFSNQMVSLGLPSVVYWRMFDVL